jgi:hypothetical protein
MGAPPKIDDFNPIKVVRNILNEGSAFTQNAGDEWERVQNAGRTNAEYRAQVADEDKVKRDAETRERLDLYNQALNDDTIDIKTRKELERLYDAGAPSSQIAEALNTAREGKGIYGVRKMIVNDKALMRDMPGRKQLLGM